MNRENQKTDAVWRATLAELTERVYHVPRVADELFQYCELGIAGRRTYLHMGNRHMFCSESDLFLVKDCVKQTNERGALYVLTLETEIARAECFYQCYADKPTFRMWTKITNLSDQPFTVDYLGSFCEYGFWKGSYDDAYLYLSSNGWYGEAQWSRINVKDLGVFDCNGCKSMKKFFVANTGAWSTKSNLPMGILENTASSEFMLWQIEANGSWEWELGEWEGGLSLNLSGPTLLENGWCRKLSPGESFEGAAAVVTRADSLNGVLESITAYRRLERVKRNDEKTLPIIYNEYMFAAWNNPTEENTARTMEVVAGLGRVKYYVIDCGWHDEDDDAFYALGGWRESRKRFPSGLKKTTDRLISLGLRPGLWIEPEVVGVNADAKGLWPEECYFRRDGKPVIVSSRYQLDFRHPLVIERMNGVMDRLVRDYGLGYVKIDYNIEPGVGPEGGTSFGDTLLDHCRGVLDWLKGVGERHPDLVVETCASGGNRMDFLTAKYSNLISTSDQVDYFKYAYIVSNMLAGILPEQAAVWNYPLNDRLRPEEVGLETIAFITINSLLGRMHLASRLERFDEQRRALIAEGLAYYDEMTPEKRRSAPYLPLGFSRWGDTFLATGIRSERKCYLAVYNMRGERDVSLPLPGLKVKAVRAGFPKSLPTDARFEAGELKIRFSEDVQARLLEIDLEEEK